MAMTKRPARGSSHYGEGTWLEPEELCYPSGGMHRRARARCEDGKFRVVRCGIPDTFFSIPCKGGGYVTMGDDGVLEYKGGQMGKVKGKGKCKGYENCATPSATCVMCDKRDESDLDPRFTQYYKSGERVEVEYEDGTKARFYVGISTGWKPVYLEVKKANSFGGTALRSSGAVKITGTGKFWGNRR